MKFVVFGEQARLGLLEGERVLDLQRAAATLAWSDERQAVVGTLLSLIESGAHGLDEVGLLARSLADDDRPGLWIETTSVRLRAPWPGRRFLLAGSNNPVHVSQAFTNLGGSPLSVEQAREQGRSGIPSGFWGQARPVMGPGDEILIPRRAQGYFDYEAEPAIILGKQGKDIKAADIRDYVWGVTMVNDWSIRIPKWPTPPNPPFMPVKNFDSSKSIGPCIVVDEIDPDDFRIQTFVNGDLRQDFRSSEMIFSFGEVLEHFSQDFTFFPGDVISGGTGSGTAADQCAPRADGSWPDDLFLHDSDLVEVRSEKIGSLRNRVVE